jgi:hypothetical protein
VTDAAGLKLFGFRTGVITCCSTRFNSSTRCRCARWSFCVGPLFFAFFVDLFFSFLKVGVGSPFTGAEGILLAERSGERISASFVAFIGVFFGAFGAFFDAFFDAFFKGQQNNNYFIKKTSNFTSGIF